MKRMPAVLLLAVILTLILGVLPAAAAVSSVSPSGVTVASGKVKSVEGSIACTAGMKFNVRANVVDASGNKAVGKAGGTCTGSSQPWKTGQIDSGLGFTCGESVTVRGQARTVQDGASRTMRAAQLTTCATGGGRDPGDILVLDTTFDGLEDSVAKALTELGYTFTELNDEDWTDNDFSSYETVIAAQDGDTQDADDVAAVRAGVIDAGQRLIFLGGTSNGGFQDGVDANLVSIQEDDSWDQGTGPPDMVISNAGHGLAAGLPGGYNFVDANAAYYMARPDGADHTKVAENGHGFTNLLHRDFGAGSFVYFTNSPNDSYWLNAADYAILKTIVGNSLTLAD